MMATNARQTRCLSSAATVSMLMAVLLSHCGASQSGPRPAPSANAGETADAAAAQETSRRIDPCETLASAETDVLRRWIATYPVRQGGGLFIFTGPEARQQEIANSLELNSITGYNITTCGTSVLVWISGFDCDGQELELTQRIQQETMMNLLESHCFLTDEINYRLATDCAQGTFPAEYCP